MRAGGAICPELEDVLVAAPPAAAGLVALLPVTDAEVAPAAGEPSPDEFAPPVAAVVPLAAFVPPVAFAALDALTREQLYGDIQEIWKARRKTIVFVTHNVREAACLGDRVLLFSPHPGRVQEEFTIDLPRPRDINSVDLAAHATRITKALKSIGKTETVVTK